MKLAYEPHVDGLRAIAVLSVLIYHIDNTIIPGGFLGVDIFFVISGYLISSIVLGSIEKQEPFIKTFYTKRIKRILPLYFSVVLISAVVAYWLFLPNDLINFAESALASNLFISNYFFWADGGYFSKAAELKPLLHTWSLSVEEQFYIVWPLFIYLFVKYLDKRLFYAVVLLSITVSIWVGLQDKDFSYYSSITRAYELMLGAAIPLLSLKKISINKHIMNLSMVTMILCFFMINKSMMIPGYVSIIVTVATVILIIGGQSRSITLNILQSKLFVSLGLISYALYMIHWPVLAFMRYVYIEPNVIHYTVAVISIFLLAILSKKYIEQPFIKSNSTFSQSLVRYVLLPSSVIVAFCSYVTITNGDINRFKASEAKIIKQISPPSKNIPSCKRAKHNILDQAECWLTSKTSFEQPAKRILLWGDSHAGHFSPFFKEMSKVQNIELFKLSFPGCPPITGIIRANRNYGQECKEHNQIVRDHIIQNGNFDLIVLAANWINYTKGANVAYDLSQPITIESSAATTYDALTKMLEEITRKQNVLLFNSVPNFYVNAGDCEVKKRLFSVISDFECGRDAKAFFEEKQILNDYLERMEQQLSALSVISFDKIICAGKSCEPSINNNIYYRDQNHLSSFGSKELYKEFEKQLLDIVNNTAPKQADK